MPTGCLIIAFLAVLGPIIGYAVGRLIWVSHRADLEFPDQLEIHHRQNWARVCA
jgi:hypothetical protein